MRTLNLYIRNFRQITCRDGFSFGSFFSAIKFFLPWRESLRKEYWNGPIEDRLPWMTFGAIEFLKNRVEKGSIIFEYGSGGSTMFFLDLGCTVCSVENDYGWFLKIKSLCKEKEKFSYLYKKCEEIENLPDGKIDDYNEFLSSNGLYCKEYVESILKYPDHYFDVVVIDGRARPSCIKASKPKIKSGGYMVVDNTERKYYHMAMRDVLHGSKRYRFAGPVPYLAHFTETTIFQVC